MARSAQPTVSAVLIVKDEEAALEGCLASLAWCDEVVVYDTGSADATVEIARRFTPKVVEGYWDDDFGGARNRALANASGEWVFIIDADEVFEGEPARVRSHLATSPAPTHTVRLVEDTTVTLGPVEAAEVLRFFRRGEYCWSGRVHEQVVPVPGSPAPVADLVPAAVLRHTGYRPDVVAAKDKVARNLALARDAHAAAPRADRSAMRVVRFNLVRSLVMAGLVRDALDLGEEMVAAGDLRDPMIARETAALLTQLGEDCDTDEATVWFERWLRVAPERATAHRARRAASTGDAAAALAAVGLLPERSVRPLREGVDRAELAPVEVWALGRLGRWADAADVAMGAARAGHLPGYPKDLVLVLREAGRPLSELVAALSSDAWSSLALLATQEPAGVVGHLLEAMHAHRPSDLTVLTCAARRSGFMAIDEAIRWAAPIRAAGLAELCPLRAIAAAQGLDPRQRALAAAVAFEAFGEVDVLGDLADALALVAPHDEAELAELIEAAAPGLLASDPEPAGAPMAPLTWDDVVPTGAGAGSGTGPTG